MVNLRYKDNRARGGAAGAKVAGDREDYAYHKESRHRIPRGPSAPERTPWPAVGEAHPERLTFPWGVRRRAQRARLGPQPVQIDILAHTQHLAGTVSLQETPRLHRRLFGAVGDGRACHVAPS